MFVVFSGLFQRVESYFGLLFFLTPTISQLCQLYQLPQWSQSSQLYKSPQLYQLYQLYQLFKSPQLCQLSQLYQLCQLSQLSSVLWSSSVSDAIAMVLNFNSGLLGGNPVTIAHTLARYDKHSMEGVKQSAKKLYGKNAYEVIQNNRGNLDRGE